MYPQECFAYYCKRPFWPVLCLKRIGLSCCNFVTITVTCSLPIILLSNYSLLIILVLAENTLLKTTCHFLMLLVGFDTLTYRKDYDISPTLVGRQSSLLIAETCIRRTAGRCCRNFAPDLERSMGKRNQSTHTRVGLGPIFSS